MTFLNPSQFHVTVMGDVQCVGQLSRSTVHHFGPVPSNQPS